MAEIQIHWNQYGLVRSRSSPAIQPCAPVVAWCTEVAAHPCSRKLVTLLHNPTACNSQTQTAMTTTTFRIVLILEAIGIKRLISHNATPTIISTTTKFIKGMLLGSSHEYKRQFVIQSLAARLH